MKKVYTTDSWDRFKESMQRIVPKIINIDTKINEIEKNQENMQTATAEETLEYLGKKKTVANESE